MRRVYVLYEGGDTPRQSICERCITASANPDAARRDIVAQDDSLHCYGCNWHAGAWIIATVTVEWTTIHGWLVEAIEHDTVCGDRVTVQRFAATLSDVAWEIANLEREG